MTTLEKRINDVATLRDRDDPTFLQAERKLKELQEEKSSKEKEIEQLTVATDELRSKSVRDKLAGKSADITGLTRLSVRKSELETEIQILGEVITRAQEELAAIKEEAKTDIELKQLQVLAEALAEFSETLEPLGESQRLLDLALNTRAGVQYNVYSLGDTLRAFTEGIRAVASTRERVEKAIQNRTAALKK